MSRRVLTAAAVVAFAVLALAGCTPTPASAEQSASPSPAPVESPSATPAPDPLATVTSLVARPQSLELRDAAGAVVASLDYLGDAAEAESTLETVFGAAAVSEDYIGNSHFPGGVVHRWGGLELREPTYGDEIAELPPNYYRPSYYVYFKASTSGNVDLTTDGGQQVGDAWAELLTASGLQTDPSGCAGSYVDYVEVPMTDSEGNEYEQRVAVAFRASDDETTIKWVTAPIEVHEEGCG